MTTYCPTSCPYLGKNGCKVACGNEEIECPVMAGIIRADFEQRFDSRLYKKKPGNTGLNEKIR